MIFRQQKLLFHIKQLTAYLSIPIKSQQNLLTLLRTIEEIFNDPGFFLFLQKVLAKAIHRASQFVNKIGGKDVIFFEEINKPVKENSNYLFGSILNKLIKKMYGYSCPKLDQKQKEQQNIEILKNILEDKFCLIRNCRQQISQYKKLTSQDFKKKKTILIHGKNLNKFEQVHTIINTKINDKTIEQKFGKVQEKDQFKRKMIEDQLKRQIIEDQLKSKMVAVLNEGGGYIFLGQFGMDLVQGMKEQCLNEYIPKIVKYKQESICPYEFDLKFEIIDLESQYKKKKIDEKLLKIILFPNSYLMYFVKQKKQYRQKFLKWQDYHKQNTYSLNQSKQIYTLMVKFYNRYKLNRKKGMIEYKSIQDKIILNNKFRKQIIYGQVKNEIFLKQNEQIVFGQIKSKIFPMKNETHQPLKLIYKHTSIFMVKESDKKLYANFTKILDQRKILYVACCPFTQYRGPSSKLIAVISHGIKFESVLLIAKETAGEKLNAFIIVRPFIVIEDVSKEKFNDYQNVFKKKYGAALKPYIQQSQKGNDTYNVYLKFKENQESIFTLIFMQAKGLRTQFLKKSKYLEIIQKS